jgi:uncharacterized membrane protein YeaQ/YmgE (transglycosylase-associated protein family)
MKILGYLLLIASILFTLVTGWAAQVSTNTCDNAAMLMLGWIPAVVAGLVGFTILYFRNKRIRLSQKRLWIVFGLLVIAQIAEAAQIRHLALAAIAQYDCS